MANEFSMEKYPMENPEADYPPAPWRLKGRGLLILRLMEINTAQLFTGSDIHPIPVLPGKTIAGMAFIDYAAGSTLNYQELIIFPALVQRKGKPGIWVSHIYVDNLQSLRGGREMWGVPKELAEFGWKAGFRSWIGVRKNGQFLVSVVSRKAAFNIRLPIWLAAYGDAAGDLRWFSGKGAAQGWVSEVSVNIPRNSPFARFGLDHPGMAIEFNDVDAWWGNIQVITNK